jgi:hypothetical protein
MPTTWNPADLNLVTLSGGNLVATSSGGSTASTAAVRATDRVTTGQFYWEITINTITGSWAGCGVCTGKAALTGFGGTATDACFILSNQHAYVQGVDQGTVCNPNIVAGTTLGLALDLTRSPAQLWVRSSAAGIWNANSSNNPVTGVGGINLTSLGGTGIALYPMAGFAASGGQVTANFGASGFVGAVPSGFTSGFPSGTSTPTNVIASQLALETWQQGGGAVQATQVSLEEWYSTAAAGQLTQLGLEQWAAAAAAQGWLTQAAVEQWAAVASVNTAAVLTQAAVEMWASVRLAGHGAPMITLIT